MYVWLVNTYKYIFIASKEILNYKAYKNILFKQKKKK